VHTGISSENLKSIGGEFSEFTGPHRTLRLQYFVSKTQLLSHKVFCSENSQKKFGFFTCIFPENSRKNEQESPRYLILNKVP